MFDFLDSLFQMTDTNLFTILVCTFIAVSIVAVFIISKIIPIHVRYKNNSVIGYTSSLIAVIYGVLAGLSALYLINNNNYASDAVQREANAVADMYRDSKWLEDPTRANIQTLIISYLGEVIHTEWPMMREGERINNVKGSVIIDEVTDQLVNYKGFSNSESLLVHDMLDEIRTLYDAREQRIHTSYSQLSPDLWVVILIGTILTLFINYLFGMNFYLHVVVVIAAAIMTSSMIFLLVTLDRPYQGEFVIEPTALESILMTIQSDKLPNRSLYIDKKPLTTGAAPTSKFQLFPSYHTRNSR